MRDDSRRLRRGAAMLLLLTTLTGCGSRDGATEMQAFVERVATASGPTKRIASVAPGVDAESLLDWAQWKYPALFPIGAATQDIEHQGVAYAVRAYPGGNYLGVSRQGEVWGLGPFTGGALQSFGAVAVYAAQVQADRCQVHAEKCGTPTALDGSLRNLIASLGLTGDPTVGRTLPHIADALPQLGKLLFFSKSLSVQRDTACASCHHPALGGGDGMGLSVGAEAVQPEVLRFGRKRADGRLLVARNANTFFNSALYDRVLFADGRVESLAPAGAAAHGGQGAPIRTPDSVGAAADPKAGPNLLAAQARFPITGVAEMRGHGLPAMSDADARVHIASRLAGEAVAQPEGQGWLPHFRRAFGKPQGSAAELITFDNIMLAIAEYERSATFVKSPWYRYVLGENKALSDAAKRGAIAFLRTPDQGGVGCVQCHQGDFFTDEKFHAIGFPQTGPGFTGDGVDTGRHRVTGATSDQYMFRTPSLLNVEATAPYGHAGNYGSLFEAFRHYAIPDTAIRELLTGQIWCYLAGYADQTDCRGAADTAARETNIAMSVMLEKRTTDPTNSMPSLSSSVVSAEVNDRVGEFMRSLTDPCIFDRRCLARWIPRPDEAPDAHQLNAVDRNGMPLEGGRSAALK